MKIVINRCFGGFSISRECAAYMAARGHERATAEYESDRDDWYGFGYVEGMLDGYDRTDPLLIEAVECLGSEQASGTRARLKVVEIPDDIDWEIDEYDGVETVREKSRSWS